MYGNQKGWCRDLNLVCMESIVTESPFLNSQICFKFASLLILSGNVSLPFRGVTLLLCSCEPKQILFGSVLYRHCFC
jgi:hypothetical protein